MIQHIQEKMLQTVTQLTGQSALTLDAYDAEKTTLQAMLSLGRLYLTLFYETRAKQTIAPTVTTPDGRELPYHSQKKRTQMTLFGSVIINRPYFYATGSGGYFPLDTAINMPTHCYSDAVQEIFSELAVEQDYRSGSQFLTRWFNLSLSSRPIQEFIITNADDAAPFYEQLPPPPSEQEANILVAQADGKGVPLILTTDAAQAVRPKRGQARSRKKEAIVTALYTQSPRPRTVDEVTNSLFKHAASSPKPSQKKAVPRYKIVQASLDGKEAAMQRLQKAVAQRNHPHITHRIALCDGAPALQKQFLDKLPTFTLVLDFIHAYEYLWKAANILYDETDPLRIEWVETQTKTMLTGATSQIVAHLRSLALDVSTTHQAKLVGIANYFERNLPYMNYDVCLRQGLPIASGVIEGACRHIVKDRMELSGMRWSQHGAEQLLKLRCVHQNGHWDTFWEYHRALRRRITSATHTVLDLPLAG
jgi:hypothetical protein